MVEAPNPKPSNLPYSQLVLAKLWQLFYCIDYSKVGPKLPQGDIEVDPTEMDPEEEHEFLEQLLRNRELNCLVKMHNVILFCNQGWEPAYLVHSQNSVHQEESL